MISLSPDLSIPVERLLAILEETSDLVTTADLDGRITYANEAFRKRLGLSAAEEAEGWTLRDGHPSAAARTLLNDAIPHAIDHGSWRGESAYLGADGEEFPVSLIVIAHRNRGGVVEYFSSIAREITEEKRAERRCAERAEALRFVAEAAAEAVWTWDLHEDRVAWSPALCALLDAEPDAFPIPLAAMMERLHPEDEGRCREALLAHLEQGAPFRLELRVRHGRDGYRTLECHGKAARDGGGRPVRMAGAMRDVTDRKAAEADLRRSEQKYRTLVEATGTGYVILDGEGRVLDANARFLELCGRNAIADVLGRNAFDWIVPREGADGTRLPLVLSDGFVRDMEADCLRPDGTTTPLALSAALLRDGPERRLAALVRERG